MIQTVKLIAIVIYSISSQTTTKRGAHVDASDIFQAVYINALNNTNH